MPGRLFFANPGPTNIPDTVLQAVSTASVDYMSADFVALTHRCVAGLKRVVRTEHEMFLYAASGHGAWEASLVNLFSPGDTLLMPECGFFSDIWSRMAADLGLTVRMLPTDIRRGVTATAITDTLRDDLRAPGGPAIRGICLVHNETSTGVALDLPEMRGAVDAAGHPALLLVDTISSLGSIDVRMDEWGIDVVVGGSQKGLMLPAGFSFTAASAKAMAAHAAATLPRFYWDWSKVRGSRVGSFVGTVPVGLIRGLGEALRLIEAEGLEAVLARHTRLAAAVRACVRAWSVGSNAAPTLFCTDPRRLSDSVTAVLMPDGHDADALRRVALEQFRVSLGGGLGRLSGRVFRIGHLGDLNEPMVLGTLGAVELSLRVSGVPHAAGGVQAAIDVLTHSEPQAALAA